MRPECVRVVALLAACVPSALAQSWDHVKVLPAGEPIRVASTRAPRLKCDFLSADNEHLTCTLRRKVFFVTRTRSLTFDRMSVRTVKLTREPLSTLAGAGIGAAVGAGLGAGVDAHSKGGDDPHLATGLFGLLGALAGAAVGAKTDFLAGPTIYRAP